MDEHVPCCSLEVHKSVENVADSPSLVLHIGKESHSKFCAVVITGNPGMIEFYEVFMLHLHKASKCRLQVMGVSQAGNVFPCKWHVLLHRHHFASYLRLD